MRKITTLLMLLLLCSIGAKAQTPAWALSSILSIDGTPVTEISSGFYIIENPGTQSPITYKGQYVHRTDVYKDGSGSIYGVNALKDLTATLVNDYGLSTNRMNYVVRIEKTNNTYTIQFNNGSYMPTMSQSYGVTLSGTPCDVYINQTSAETPTIFVIAGSEGDYTSTFNLKGTNTEVYDEDLWATKGANGVYTWRFFKVNLDYTEEPDPDPIVNPIDNLTNITSGVYWIDAINNKGEGALYDEYSDISTTKRQIRTKLGTKFTSVTDLSAIDKKYLWNLEVNSNGTFILRNINSARYLVADNARNQNLSGTDVANLQAEDIVYNEKNYFSFSQMNYTYGTDALYLHTNDNGSSSDPCLSYWNGTGDTSLKFTLYRVGDLDDITVHTVTLNYVSWNNETIMTRTFAVKGGSVIDNSFLTEKGLATIEYYKDFNVEKTTVNSDVTLTVNCTPDFPFAEGKVYTIFSDKHSSQSDRGGYWNVSSATKIEGDLSAAKVVNGYYTFEHVAGTQNMFRVYSYGGSGYVTMKNVPTTNSDGTTSPNASIQTDYVAWDNTTYGNTSEFLAIKHGNEGGENNYTGFRLQHPGTKDVNFAIRYNKVVNVWNSASSYKYATSNLKVEEVDVMDLVLLPEYITSPTPAKYESTLSQEELASLLATPTHENYQTIFNSLTGNSTAGGTTFDELVDVNAVYQIHGYRGGPNPLGYFKTEADANGSPSTSQDSRRPNLSVGSDDNSSKTMDMLFLFEKNGDGYNIKNVNSGLYIGKFDTSILDYPLVNVPNTVYYLVDGSNSRWGIKDPTLTYKKNTSDKDYRQYLNSVYNPDGSNYSKTIAAYHNLNGGSSNVDTPISDGNAFYIKRISTLPLSVSAAGWTAFCFPVKVTVPEGVTVYQATTNTDSYLHLEEVPAGTVLPAGQGFLCEAAEGTYDFAISAADAADLSGNLLSGATLKRTGMTANTYYGLGNKGGNVGFYKANMTTVPANKAFLLDSSLQASGAREMLSFQFGPATGIDMTENAAAIDTSVLYDLNGRRVFYPSRGIYVTADGKKVFLK